MQKIITLATVTALSAALVACGKSSSQSADQTQEASAPVTASAPAATVAPADTVASAPQTDASNVPPSPASSAALQASGLSWIVGKYPSEVASDSRFKAVFTAAAQQQWAKIADRLHVSEPMTLQDGYYVGTGCKAHACDSDAAAFAINVATGKGDIVFTETPDGKTSATVHVYAWPELPVTGTPLSKWAASENIQLDGASSH